MHWNRKSETGPTPYRTGRFFVVDSKWYFTTREGLNHGPFPTKEKTEQACQTYVHVCLQIEDRIGQGRLNVRPPQVRSE